MVLACRAQKRTGQRSKCQGKAKLNKYQYKWMQENRTSKNRNKRKNAALYPFFISYLPICSGFYQGALRVKLFRSAVSTKAWTASRSSIFMAQSF